MGLKSKHNPLRAAFSNLKVSEPLKLNKNGSQFQAPISMAPPREVPFSDAAQKKEPKAEVAKFEAAPIELPQTEIAAMRNQEVTITKTHDDETEVPQSELANLEGPYVEVPHTGIPQNKVTQDLRPHLEQPENKEPQIVESKQNQFEVPQRVLTQSKQTRREVTQIEVAEETKAPPLGYFKLAHSVFWDSELRMLSGDSFRLFLWMSSRAWQFPTSKGVIRASIRWITESTGMSHATVSRALKILRDHELITVLATDFHSGNLWRVSPKAIGNLGTEGSQKNSSESFSEPTQNEGAATSERASSALKTRQEVPQKEVQFKNSNKIKKTTLSIPADAPEKVKAYFEHVRPMQKREMEFKHFQNLVVDFRLDEIGECLDYVLTHGLLKTNESCHSPMAYLAVSMSEVLADVMRRKKRVEVQNRDVKVATARADEEERERALMDQAEEAFRMTYSTAEEQELILRRYTPAQQGGFQLPGNIAKRIAIFDWYQSQNEAPQNR